ncbi:MAG: phosphopantetheine-binding protein [Firmicutes bacterium]|nr:phosphopantetheine-binding protein [Bacillota bacterium]
MEQLIAILTEIHDDVDYQSCTTLVDDGVLDSFDIVTLISEISDTFDVTIPPSAIVPENFNSAAALWTLIQELEE